MRMPSGIWNGIIVVQALQISAAFSETFMHTLVSEMDRLVSWLSYHHIYNPLINFMTLCAHIHHTYPPTSIGIHSHSHLHPRPHPHSHLRPRSHPYPQIYPTTTPHPHSHSHSHPITFGIGSTILILPPPHHPLPLACTPCKAAAP